MRKEASMITAIFVAAINLAVLYGLITADAAPLWIALAESVVVLVGGYAVRRNVYSKESVEGRNSRRNPDLRRR